MLNFCINHLLIHLNIKWYSVRQASSIPDWTEQLKMVQACGDHQCFIWKHLPGADHPLLQQEKLQDKNKDEKKCRLTLLGNHVSI